MTSFFWKSYIGHQTAAAVYPNVSRHLYLAVSQSVKSKKKKKKKRKKERKMKTNLFSCPSLFQPISPCSWPKFTVFYVAEKFSKMFYGNEIPGIDMS